MIHHYRTFGSHMQRKYMEPLLNLFPIKMKTLVPEPIYSKLIAKGYDSLEKLPNNQNMDRWTDVRLECGLTGAEMNQLINIKFPVQQGKNHHPSYHSNCLT